MATSKTLTPTNVTISIPAMSDRPNQSVNSNCIDKLADAVNKCYNITTPSNYEFTASKVDSSYSNLLYCRKMGHMVQIGGEFKAAVAIGFNAEVIGTGFPKAINNTLGQFTAKNGTQDKAIQLDINSSGELTTFYSGSIAIGDVIRFSVCYISSD